MTRSEQTMLTSLAQFVIILVHIALHQVQREVVVEKVAQKAAASERAQSTPTPSLPYHAESSRFAQRRPEGRKQSQGSQGQLRDSPDGADSDEANTLERAAGMSNQVATDPDTEVASCPTFGSASKDTVANYLQEQLIQAKVLTPTVYVFNQVMLYSIGHSKRPKLTKNLIKISLEAIRPQQVEMETRYCKVLRMCNA